MRHLRACRAIWWLPIVCIYFFFPHNRRTAPYESLPSGATRDNREATRLLGILRKTKEAIVTHVPVSRASALIVLATLVAALTGGTDRASAMVTVSGGPNAGSYVLHNDNVPCQITEERPPAPRHQFDATLGGLSPNKDPGKLTLLMVIVPNADVKGSNGVFFTSLNFGDISRGTHYTVETRPGEKVQGSGAVTIAMRGQDATVTLDVKAANGTAYKGTILCIDVSRY